MYVRGQTSTICLCSIKSSLPSLYPLRFSRDELFQALCRFSILQVTESWTGPENKARCENDCKLMWAGAESTIVKTQQNVAVYVKTWLSFYCVFQILLLFSVEAVHMLGVHIVQMNLTLCNGSCLPSYFPNYVFCVSKSMCPGNQFSLTI